jgi:hypothetical protein
VRTSSFDRAGLYATERGRATLFCVWCDGIILPGGSAIQHGVCDGCLPVALGRVLSCLDGTRFDNQVTDGLVSTADQP